MHVHRPQWLINTGIVASDSTSRVTPPRNPLIQVSNALPIAGSNCELASGRLVTPEDVQSDIRGPVCIVGDDDWVCDPLSVLLET